jgi:nitrite reductase/ring-hydroxylating ferredoxin subunit
LKVDHLPRWVRIADVAECPPGTSLEAIVEDRVIALFNVDGSFFALDGVCPHQGGPLGKGQLSGCIVTCPWHGWQFDVRSGQHQLNAKFSHTRYDVRTEEGSLLIDLETPG